MGQAVAQPDRLSHFAMLSHFAGRALLGALVLVQAGPQIPAPQGLVNDFAGALPAASIARMERIAQDVRDKAKGELRERYRRNRDERRTMRDSARRAGND